MDIERISNGDELIAILVRNEYRPSETEFLTTPELMQQIGYIVYEKGAEIRRHVHRKIHRDIVGSSEALLILEGRLRMKLFSSEGSPLCTRELCRGDLVLLASGGHGFQVDEDAVILEVKQGPYAGVDDKKYF